MIYVVSYIVFGSLFCLVVYFCSDFYEGAYYDGEARRMILLSVAWPLFLALILVFVSIEIVKWLQPRLATTKRLLRSKVRDVKVKLLAKRIRKTNKRDLPAWW